MMLFLFCRDQFQIAGKECNMCWASWIGRISTENSTLVDSLVLAGAIIFTRTNMAQGAWFPEGDNNVYGRADNPFHRDMVTGVGQTSYE
jgi:amidase